MIAFRRIIRSRGTNTGVVVGSTRFAVNLPTLRAFSRKSRHVFVFIDEAGNEGTMRSGRLMRAVDAHVRNTLPSGVALQRPLPFGEIAAKLAA